MIPVLSSRERSLPARCGAGLLRVAVALLATLPPLTVIGADEQVSMALSVRIEQLGAGQEVRVQGETIAARRLLPELYRRRELRPVWLDSERRAQLAGLAEASRTHGLDPADYHAKALRGLESAKPVDPGTIADRDLLYSDALIRLVYHLRFGKIDPRELYPQWGFSRSLGRTDPVDALEALLASEHLARAVDGYAPQLPVYDYLRRALAQLRATEAAGGWGSVPAGATLKPGMQDSRVPALRARLTASGDLPVLAGAEPELFDQALEAAVRDFQARHELQADGAVGRRTLQALNVAAAQRIEQVRVNLERLRWVAQELTGDYLLVDIAGFSARLYLDAQIAWSSRAVVGSLYRETPDFRATLRSIVLNPAWIVPPTILREDVLPRIIRDPHYLEANQMHALDAAGHAIDTSTIAWERYRSEAFPYHIVQEPGPANPLGTLKFDMPNRYGVYLHDTPAKELFERTPRAFSSGCIRLDQPLALAILLLDDAEQWNEQALRAAIATGETRVLPAKRRVPVIALYLTAEADSEGVLYFRPDLYGRDAKVSAAMAAPFRFTPVDRPRGKQPERR
jgi:murein L,D-transpeptidase YcbB/YkuD